MKAIFTGILALILTTGIIIITTDCEVYFNEIHHNNTTAGMPADVEHTHASHPMVNDIFSEVTEDLVLPEIPVTINAGVSVPSFNPDYFSYIWQPPKFS